MAKKPFPFCSLFFLALPFLVFLVVFFADALVAGFLAVAEDLAAVFACCPRGEATFCLLSCVVIREHFSSYIHLHIFRERNIKWKRY